jgi:hypothetical protein
MLFSSRPEQIVFIHIESLGYGPHTNALFSKHAKIFRSGKFSPLKRGRSLSKPLYPYFLSE